MSNQIRQIRVTAKNLCNMSKLFFQCSSLFLRTSVSSRLNKRVYVQIHLISRLFNHQYLVVIQLNSTCNSMTDKSEDGTDDFVQCEETAFAYDINVGCMRGCGEGLILQRSSRQSCFNNSIYPFVCINASLLKECEDSAFVSINLCSFNLP